MKRRHPLPTRWLMTDERQGDSLWTALARLPRGSGIVFRHYATPPCERRALYEQVRKIARARRQTLIVAGSQRLAIAWKADGAHGRTPHRSVARPFLLSVPAHDAREVIAARNADLLFVSPVFATRSHPGGRALGPRKFAALVRRTRQPVAALGGMNAARARFIGAERWAAIDAWSSRTNLR